MHLPFEDDSLAKFKILTPAPDVENGSCLSMGCTKCVYKNLCGGIYKSFDCLSECCGKYASCGYACPLAHDFVRMNREVGGFDPTIRNLYQSAGVGLPKYIPQILHRYSRSSELEEPFVALPTTAVVALIRKMPTLTGEEMRRYFRIGRNAKVVLVSVAPDRDLELLWRDLRSLELPNALSRLGILHLTSPNFSLPLDVPRTEGLLNIARSKQVAEAFSQARLSVIPHLNAWHERQWKNWAGFLREHNQVSIVAKEFQTGLANRRNALWQIDQLLNLEQRLGRSLHVLAIAGRRYIPELSRMSGTTIIDSRPFFLTIKRRVLQHSDGRWILERLPKGQPLDSRLNTNLEAYKTLIELKFKFPIVQSPKSMSKDVHLMPPLFSKKEIEGIQGELFNLDDRLIA